MLGYLSETAAKQYHWTPGAIECYKRGCRCTDCPTQELFKDKCRMKEAVLSLVAQKGPPPENKDNYFYGLNETENRLVNSILNGATTKERIAEDLGMKVGSLAFHLSGVYDFFSTHGFVFKKYHNKFNELVEYLQSLPQAKSEQNIFLLNENQNRRNEHMYDKDLDLEYANYLKPLVDAVKKGYSTLKEVSEETGIATSLVSVYFSDLYRHHLNKYVDKGDNSARETVCNFIRTRLIDKHNSEKQQEKSEIPTKQTSEPAKPLGYKINDKLTEQEETVKNLLLDGLNYQQIAEKLVLSPTTVKTHVNNIFQKRDYHTLQELICTEYRIRQKELENRIADLESRSEPKVFNFSGLRLRIQDEIEKLNTKLKAIDEFEQLVNL